VSAGACVQISAALTVLVACGFGLPVPWVAWRLRRTGELPTFLGLFPMYGGPLFRRVSQRTFRAVLASFASVCALDLVAGCALWQGDRTAALLTVALLPIEAAYWLAFALPIPPLVAIVRIVLIAVGWSALT
jgi:hypothetical protein